MVQSGQSPIEAVGFESRLHAGVPVEVIERDQLLTRVQPARLAAPQRPNFTMLLLMRSAVGSHTVDFSEIPARPGRLIQVRPGQVQIWNTVADFDATLVLSQPATLPPQTWFPGHRTYCDLDSQGRETAEQLLAALRLQQLRFAGDEPSARMMVAMFAALVALFDQAHVSVDDDNLPEVYVAFRRAVEIELTAHHDVVDYAELLGYSARTISRACQQVTGQTAKGVLTDRLILEAKRLLVHSDSSAAAIAIELGFSEPTNFSKFFTRNTGLTPAAYRSQNRPSQNRP